MRLPIVAALLVAAARAAAQGAVTQEPAGPVATPEERGGPAPTKWGCTEASVDLPVFLPRARNGAPTPIPPAPLGEDLGELLLGLPFSHLKPHNLSLAPDQVAFAEHEFCTRDAELVCATATERERIVADVTRRIARISSNPTLSAVARAATVHVREDLAQGRIPLVFFNTALHNGPTAAVIRYRDPRGGRWVLGMAFANNFTSAREDALFLDGVFLQEMVHYDDVAFLPDPMRCYESNMEIRGHHAMILYWLSVASGHESTHPRILRALSAGLDVNSSRATWYRYLNQVEKTDFRIEDQLVSLEFHTLPSLSTERGEDQRFLGQLADVVSSALTKATHVRRYVRTLPADSINSDARVMSAVARIVPRVMLRYEHVRGDLRDTDGLTRGIAMASQIRAIRLSLDALGSAMGALAADPDFRRKSDLVGVD